ncbi:hypothetical protein BBF96_05140 [Anoxybacter fermentans]|uniref:Uncharacterized protein n=1 Tax=Anoxybacter fermentans TaxID=1323375 RepID=A0A3Q9HPT9_9FIRM|nr:hypothetical protein BBF96_05140 [Anoxybacter fermentans]
MGYFLAFILFNLLVQKSKKLLQIKTTSKLVIVLGVILMGLGLFFVFPVLLSYFERAPTF